MFKNIAVSLKSLKSSIFVLYLFPGQSSHTFFAKFGELLNSLSFPRLFSKNLICRGIYLLSTNFLVFKIFKFNILGLITSLFPLHTFSSISLSTAISDTLLIDFRFYFFSQMCLPPTSGPPLHHRRLHSINIKQLFANLATLQPDHPYQSVPS